MAPSAARSRIRETSASVNLRDTQNLLTGTWNIGFVWRERELLGGSVRFAQKIEIDPCPPPADSRFGPGGEESARAERMDDAGRIRGAASAAGSLCQDQ